MKVVVVEEGRFDREFEATRTKMRVDTLELSQETIDGSPLARLYRSFNYEICELQDRLKKAVGP